MDWSAVDYCDVFIRLSFWRHPFTAEHPLTLILTAPIHCRESIDSHSDGTHSLQSIHWLSFWRHPFTAEHPLLRHISPNLMKKQTHPNLGWSGGEHIYIFDWTISLRLTRIYLLSTLTNSQHSLTSGFRIDWQIFLMNDWSVISSSCWWQEAVLPLLSSSDVTSCVSGLQHVSSRFCPSAVSLYLSSLSLQHSGSFFISFFWFSCRSEGQRFALWSIWAFSSLDKRCLALWGDVTALSTAFEEGCSSETLRERERETTQAL